MSESLYTPSEWGKVFHGLKTTEALGAGSAGPGKTTVLLMNDMDIINHEHKRCELKGNDPRRLDFGSGRAGGSSVAWILFLRRVSTMLDQTIARAHRIFPRVDPGVKWTQDNSGGGTFRFSSGLRYQFGSCKDIGSYERYMGNEYTAVNADELVQFDKEQIDQIQGRIRTSDPHIRPFLRFRAMSNPVMRREGEESFTVRDPHWVRRRFVDPAPQGKKILKRKITRRDGTHEWVTRIYLPATLYDNPDKTFVADYEVRLLSAPKHMQRALLFGDWYMTENSFFAEYWDAGVHVIKPFPIPKGWIRFRSLDWGFKTPGCIHWWALSPDGVLFCEREKTFKNMIDRDVARMILQIETGMGLAKGGVSTITGPADDQIREQRGERVKTKEQTFIAQGVMWAMAYKRAGSRQRAAELIVNRLTAHRGRTRDPDLVFFESCKKVTRDLLSIQTSANPLEAEIPNDGPQNHWYASLRYAVLYADSLFSGAMDEATAAYDDYEDDEDLGTCGYGNMLR